MITNEFERYNSLLNKYSDFENEKINYKTSYKFDISNMEVIKRYELEKLVSDTDFIASLINICQFVYRIVPPGKPMIANPYLYSGFELLEKCKTNSLNCAGHSILYNDIMLTLGYISKCIFCRSFDIYDDDSHVVCQVYHPKTDKWIVVDPAQGCIPCDETGKYLDILELRNIIKHRKELTLLQSKRAYHNKDKVAQYIRYLNKYLFMFIIIQTYGLYYDTSTAKLITPPDFACSEYDMPFKCQLTHNSYYIFN